MKQPLPLTEIHFRHTGDSLECGRYIRRNLYNLYPRFVSRHINLCGLFDAKAFLVEEH